ncbi:MAG: phosphate signaling complex protein PhoU [Bowdeniella nasicola]|nr:phosphate signaling complex protein PhoU [Bowdeniella nasicola]
MRAIFRQELHDLGEHLTEMARLVATAIDDATTALAQADVERAQRVIDGDEAINVRERHVNELCVSVLARQQPVATDLRVVVAALMMSTTLERMGDLARHIAYVARGRYPHAALTGRRQAIVEQMGEAATTLGAEVVELMESRTLRQAADIEAHDDVLDTLHRETFAAILDPGEEVSRQEVIDVVLLARFLERFGDHCVSLARRTAFLVTGDLSNSVVLALEDDASDPPLGS